MNERIKELAKQANANELSYGYYRSEKKPENAVAFHSVDLEKFAELIVRECAKAAGDFEYARLHDSLVEDHVLKHFGVEE